MEERAHILHQMVCRRVGGVEEWVKEVDDTEYWTSKETSRSIDSPSCNGMGRWSLRYTSPHRFTPSTATSAF